MHVRSQTRQVTTGSGRAALLWVFLPLFALYLLTASRSLPYHIDPLSNVVTAWKLGTDGTVVLLEHDHLTGDPHWGAASWFIDGPRGTVSQYPPGTAMLAAPFYAALRGQLQPTEVSYLDRDGISRTVTYPMPPLLPAALAVATFAATAVTLLALVFRRIVPWKIALVGAYLFGLGTPTWSVSADALWQHGPAQLWLIAGILALSCQRTKSGGAAFGVATLTRPLTALIAAGYAVAAAWRVRSWKPMVRIGIPVFLGTAALLFYSQLAFGIPLPGGAAYGGNAARNLFTVDLLAYGKNVFGALFSPQRGLLIWTPFLLTLLPGIPRAWQISPAWARHAALGGTIYLLVHLAIDDYPGGDGFFAYRYPLETLAVAAPLLLLCYTEWIRPVNLRQWMFWTAAAASIGFQAYGALVL